MASIPVIEKNYSGNICFSEIVDKAESGEPRAIEVLHQAAQYLGEALAMIFDMLDVDLMVINGDIVAAKNIIQKTLIESVIKNSHSKQPPNKEFIKFSNFGPEVGTVGAAASAVQSIYSAFGVNNN
jgi:predicted NBD/HSP70 family sugar kinase